MMATNPPAAAHTPAPRTERGGATEAASGPTTAVVYWRYLIFWLLFFGLLYFISLYGIVAEA
jgi:hypothetical protein